MRDTEISDAELEQWEREAKNYCDRSLPWLACEFPTREAQERICILISEIRDWKLVAKAEHDEGEKLEAALKVMRDAHLKIIKNSMDHQVCSVCAGYSRKAIEETARSPS